jgi:hypothetical protein
MKNKKTKRPLHNIMRRYAKPPKIQKRQSDLLMSFANNEHAAVAKILQQWLLQKKTSEQ